MSNCNARDVNTDTSVGGTTFRVHSPRVKSFEKRSSIVAWYFVWNHEDINSFSCYLAFPPKVYYHWEFWTFPKTFFFTVPLFIRPESDHCLPFVNNSLTDYAFKTLLMWHWLLKMPIQNYVVNFADAQEPVDLILNLNFGQDTYQSWGLVKILMLNLGWALRMGFDQGFETEVWWIFWSWIAWLDSVNIEL